MVTTRLSKVMCTFAVSALLIGGGANVASAGDACKDVKFQFKNLRTDLRAIQVYKVTYFNAANSKTQTEDIKNLVCPTGLTCTMDGDNLRDSEGEDLTNIVFFFHDQELDGGWSKNDGITQKKIPVTKKCSARMTYKGDPIWTINNGGG